MWFFNSPKFVFGEDALSWLAQLSGRRAFIVTDTAMQQLGHLELVRQQLALAGMQCADFHEVEPDPSLDTVRRCAKAMADFQPDWVVGLGGGSVLDAAKAAWFIYERPDVPLDAINPVETFGLRAKAHLVAIPTTSGSGSEATPWSVLTDTGEKRKIGLGSYEIIPDLAIVDPVFSQSMPAWLAADTGIDALSHAVEAYSASMANEFSDALCVHSARMIFENLPSAVLDGPDNAAARGKMAVAAAIAGLAMGNSNVALAHSLGHAAGAVLKLPHGRLTGMLLPYSIEFNVQANLGRYRGLAQALHLKAGGDREAGVQLAQAARGLLQKVGLPQSFSQAGISQEQFDRALTELCDRAELDSGLVFSPRFAYRDDLQRLFEYAYAGRPVDF
jgi:alcohol dehydrogenase class IV